MLQQQLLTGPKLSLNASKTLDFAASPSQAALLTKHNFHQGCEQSSHVLSWTCYWEVPQSVGTWAALAPQLLVWLAPQVLQFPDPDPAWPAGGGSVLPIAVWLLPAGFWRAPGRQLDVPFPWPSTALDNSHPAT